MKVLVCDAIPDEGIEELKQAGFEVDLSPTISNELLIRVVSNYDALIVRSRTKVTKEIIVVGEKLKAIGRAGVGLDNIDVETAEKRGIVVLNVCMHSNAHEFSLIQIFKTILGNRLKKIFSTPETEMHAYIHIQNLMIITL